MNFLHKTYSSLINLIYPLTCTACNCFISPLENEDTYLCKACKQNIRFNTPPFCSTCGKSLFLSPAGEALSAISRVNCCVDCQNAEFYYDKAWSSCLYESPIRECIHRFKYKSDLKIVKLLSKIMIDFARDYIPMQKFDLVSAVPIHPSKLKIREFNQSAMLSQNIGRFFKIPVNNNILKRTRATLPQSELSRRKREQNVKGAFSLNYKKIKDKTILLVDDIYTTGLTINECAKVLKQNNSGNVMVFTLARGY